jgi:hypothetical protein
VIEYDPFFCHCCPSKAPEMGAVFIFCRCL